MQATNVARNSMKSGLCAASALIALAAGCASPGPRGELPFGEWSGEGTFVYERWQDEDQKEPLSIHGEYTTTLSIRPGRLGDREVIELEILTERETLPGWGDKTLLRAALVEAKRVSDSTVLYQVVACLLNPEPGKELEPDDHFRPYEAVCTTRGETTTFQISYEPKFVDTFRFHGPYVEKTGILGPEDWGFCQWFERLKRRE